MLSSNFTFAKTTVEDRCPVRLDNARFRQGLNAHPRNRSLTEDGVVRLDAEDQDIAYFGE